MDSGNFLLDLTAQHPGGDAGLSAVSGKLWALFGRLAESYTGAASSSLRAETAQALLQSACFLIGLGLTDGADTPALVRQLRDEDFDQLFQKGLEEMAARIEMGKALLEKARETRLNVHNTAYHGTLRELGVFFDRYNYYYFAHEIPCMLDYPLAAPVDDKRLGIEYINEYLRRFVLENELCALFDARAVGLLVGRLCPDDGLICIYEAVVTRAVAMETLKCDVLSLEMTAQDVQHLRRAVTQEKALEKWRESSQALSDFLGLDGGDARAYLLKTAEAAFAHVRRASEADRLDALLPSLRDERARAREQADQTLYIDGDMMEDEKLRALIDELTSCRYVSDKITMVQENVKSTRDLFEVLNIGFWGDECAALFMALDVAERKLLSNRLHLYKKENPDWKSESGWEERFFDFMKQT